MNHLDENKLKNSNGISLVFAIIIILSMFQSWIAVDSFMDSGKWTLFKVASFFGTLYEYVDEGKFLLISKLMFFGGAFIIVVWCTYIIAELLNMKSKKLVCLIAMLFTCVSSISFLLTMWKVNYEFQDLLYGLPIAKASGTIFPYAVIVCSVVAFIFSKKAGKMIRIFDNPISVCNNCKNKIEKNARYCTYCGSEVEIKSTCD